MFGFGNFFKLPSHYVFDYKPMFYDPKKERREAVRKQVRYELGLEHDPQAYKYTIRFRSQAFNQRKIKRGQNTRLILILIFLLLITYLFWQSDILDMIFQSFMK